MKKARSGIYFCTLLIDFFNLPDLFTSQGSIRFILLLIPLMAYAGCLSFITAGAVVVQMG
jgi:hypothetical protein